ncbi:hypothetical protein BDB00DRAFT_827937 [Zychaea mexicana]|uniref:uncharacterized protein n=1 Tax=Zychaea mexicana TaxID=64656 RepID=UPI0022FDD07D|nr:uncharacterized protein BDB00DRAFT_827937 [Zychaea mexicana]KAI9492557.1 hypothetical protein BDB00DRAFT_827937 [Zychaea mexicana]
MFCAPRFGEAVQDAQRIISLAPTWAMGYCRLGDLYAQQGKQLDAIDTYSIGLQSVSQDASLYAQLIEGKHSAELQNEKRVDFIRSLPVEVMAKIITLLPRDAKLVCLQVSSIWCKRTLEFSGSWRVSSGDDMTDEQSIKVVTYIAAYVEQLTIDTSNQQVWNQLLVDMQGGHFRKITSLHLTGIAGRSINRDMLVPMSVAFSKMNNTLTRLQFDANNDYHQSHLIKLADLLCMCTNLTSLRYRSESTSFDWIGAFTYVGQRLTLTDLEIKCHTSLRCNIEPLLQRCHKLKRLVLGNCSWEGLLNSISRNGPSLEIFSFDDKDTVPDVLEDDADMERQSSGLRFFHVGNAKRYDDLFTLIRNHSASLEDLSLSIYNGGFYSIGQSVTYSDIRLNKLKKFTFTRDNYNIMEPFLRHVISTSDNLRHLCVNGSVNAEPIVRTLLTRPRLECLEINPYHHPFGIQHPWTQLFEAYAASSSALTFQMISLKQYDLSGASLTALGKISTLQEVTLENLPRATGPMIVAFLTKVGNNVTTLNLSTLPVIRNDELKTVAGMKGLRALKLRQLPNVTENGVIRMVDTMTSKLRCLTIERCSGVTEKAIVHAKQKINIVEYQAF